MEILLRQDLLALRQERGLTQDQLGELAGLSPTSIIALEGKQTATVPVGALLRVAVALGARVSISLQARRKGDP